MAKASFERMAAKLATDEEKADAAARKAEPAVPLTAAQRILKAWEIKDYFRWEVQGWLQRVCSMEGLAVQAGEGWEARASLARCVR